MNDETPTEPIHYQPYTYPGPSGITGVLWAYPILGFLLMVINLYCIVHAIKSGRPYYWVWIIFVMPVLGAAAYFFVEMRPNLRGIDWESLKWRFSSPQTRIATLNETANESPTVKNRTRLAREYELQGQWSLAAKCYRECLTGVFVYDARLRIYLASALLEAGDLEPVHQIASQVQKQRDPKLEAERQLALYRCQAAVGKLDLAIEGLSALSSRLSSLGPLFYLAETKAAAGQHSEAIQDLQRIIYTYRRGNALLRKMEQQWYIKASRMLRNIFK